MFNSWHTRVETAADIAAIRAVNLQAFGRAYEPDIVDALRADSSAWWPGLSIIATTEAGEAVGHVLLSRCRIGVTPALILGPCAVLPAYQGQGVGGAVIRTALAAARRQGHRFVVLLGHADYYPRFGFEPAEPFGISFPNVESGPHLMALALGTDRLPAGVIDLPASWNI
ncbi:GNAT family N-acetyltransferase [Kribbella deserti]|uniref:GNAT family N-acetyltransferase n=1 Tax=Kribbella deserti TaxID=1926257 RepID=A0ABV6QR74_9ACTN